MSSFENKLLDVTNSLKVLTMEVGLFDVGLVEVGECWPKLQKEYWQLHATKRVR